MALPAQQSDMRFFRSGASADGLTVLDPNASLGNFRAAQQVNIQSTLTGNMPTVNELTDSTQIDDSPAGPVDTRSPLVNSGDYQQASSLLHWYRFGLDPLDLSSDYGNGTLIRLDTIRGALGAADIEIQQPGQFDQQRRSVHFNSGGAADNQALVSGSAGQAWGIANAWTISSWARPTTVAAGNSCLLHLRSGAGTGNGVNGIRVTRSADSLSVAIVDDTTLADAKAYLYSAFFTANVWTYTTISWDGTTLQAYKDGVPIDPDVVIEDDSITMSDTPATRRLIVGGVNNGVADPTQEWFGQIFSVAIWGATLSAAAIAQQADFGDGVGSGVYDLTGYWLVFLNGTNAFQARQISFHDNATGLMRFALGFTTTALTGDAYRVGRALELFADGPTAPECSVGVVDHRMVVFQNGTGEQLQNIRFYLVPLDPRAISYEIAAGVTDIGATGIPPIADDEDTPDITTIGTNFFSTVRQIFRQPRDFATADDTPASSAGGDLNINNGTNLPIWVRRTLGPLTRRGISTWLLVAEAASASVSGAGPWRSACILTTEPVGFTSEFSVVFDRTPRTFGGARVIATLVDADAGVAVEGVPIFIELISGPGTIESPSAQPIETDEDGQVLVQYVAPSNEGDVGATVVVEARYFDEVAP